MYKIHSKANTASRSKNMSHASSVNANRSYSWNLCHIIITSEAGQINIRSQGFSGLDSLRYKIDADKNGDPLNSNGVQRNEFSGEKERQRSIRKSLAKSEALKRSVVCCDVCC